MISGLKKRLGIFFTLLGAAVLGLFFTSDTISQPQIGYLFWGVVFFGIGVMFLRRGRTPPEESQRFRLVRRLFSGKKGGNPRRIRLDRLEDDALAARSFYDGSYRRLAVRTNHRQRRR